MGVTINYFCKYIKNSVSTPLFTIFTAMRKVRGSTNTDAGSVQPPSVSNSLSSQPSFSSPGSPDTPTVASDSASSISSYTDTESSMAAPTFSQFTPQSTSGNNNSTLSESLDSRSGLCIL